MVSREKELIVKELIERLKDTPSLFVTGFKGLSAQDMNELRRKLDKMPLNFMVVKNRIAKLALEQSKLNKVIDLIDGSCGFAFGEVAPEAISKMLVNFAKEHDALRICGAMAWGEVLNIDYIKEMASLPSRETLVATVVLGLAWPMTSFVGVLHRLFCSVVNVIDRIKEKKEEING